MTKTINKMTGTWSEVQAKLEQIKRDSLIELGKRGIILIDDKFVKVI